MPVVSRYCSICNKLITAREIESGEAVIYQTYVYCSKCKEEAMPIIEAIRAQAEKEEKEAAREEKKSIPKSGTARFRISSKHRPPSRTPHKQKKSRTGLFKAPRPAPGARKPPRPEHRARPAAHTPAPKPPAPEEPARPGPPAHEPPPEASPFEMEAVGVESVPAPEPLPTVWQVAQPQPVEAPAGEEPVEMAAQEPHAAQAEPLEPQPEVVEMEPVELEVVEVQPAEPEAIELDVVEAGAQEAGAGAPGGAATFEKAPAGPPKPRRLKPPTRKARSIQNVRSGKKHPLLEKRRSALHPPAKKKTSWLFIVVLLLMALGIGAIVAYKQFFMLPEEKKIIKQKEEDEKPRYVEAENEIAQLVELAGKIAERPQDYPVFTRKADELSQSALPTELTLQLNSAKKEAKEKFDAAAKTAFEATTGEYESHISAGNLKEALSTLESFPDAFKDTGSARNQISKFIPPIKKTLEVLEDFRDKKAQARALEQEGRLDEAAELIEKITFNPDEVLPEHLTEIAPEAARLRRLAQEERKRIAEAVRKLRAAFQEARNAAVDLAENGSFDEAFEQLTVFRAEYPASQYEGVVMVLIEEIVEKKRLAALRNFFNGSDLDGWAMQGEWKVTDNVIAGASGGENAWLLKGDPSWTDYALEFDFNPVRGSLIICLRTAPGEPESGLTARLPERLFRHDTWYHVSCEVTGGKIYITTSLNNQKMLYIVKQASGIPGFLLPPGSEVRIKNVSIEMP